MKKFILSPSIILLVLSTSFFGQETPEKFTYENIYLMDRSFISRSELMNKIIIVNIWATWCKYCIKEMPDLNGLVRKYQNRDDVVFLAVAPDDKDHLEKLEHFLEKNKFLFRQVAPDTTPAFLDRIEEIRYPTTVVYNKYGQLEEKFVGVLKKSELKKIDWIINESVIDR